MPAEEEPLANWPGHSLQQRLRKSETFFADKEGVDQHRHASMLHGNREGAFWTLQLPRLQANPSVQSSRNVVAHSRQLMVDATEIATVGHQAVRPSEAAKRKQAQQKQAELNDGIHVSIEDEAFDRKMLSIAQCSMREAAARVEQEHQAVLCLDPTDVTGQWALSNLLDTVGRDGICGTGENRSLIERYRLLLEVGRELRRKRNRTRMDHEKLRVKYDENAVFTQVANEMRTAAQAEVMIRNKASLKVAVEAVRDALFPADAIARQARREHIKDHLEEQNAKLSQQARLKFYTQDDTPPKPQRRRLGKTRSYRETEPLRKRQASARRRLGHNSRLSLPSINDRYQCNVQEQWERGPARLLPKDADKHVVTEAVSRMPAGRARQLKTQTSQLLSSLAEPSPYDIASVMRQHAADARTDADGRVHSSIVAVTDKGDVLHRQPPRNQNSKTRQRMEGQVLPSRHPERTEREPPSVSERFQRVWRCIDAPVWIQLLENFERVAKEGEADEDEKEKTANPSGVPKFNPFGKKPKKPKLSQKKLQRALAYEKVLHTWEGLADSIYAFTHLRAIIADYVTQDNANPHEEVIPTLVPDKLVRTMVHLSLYRTPDPSEMMRSWLEELLRNTGHRAAEEISNVMLHLRQTNKLMCDVNHLDTYLDRLRAHLDEQGMVERLREGTEQPSPKKDGRSHSKT